MNSKKLIAVVASMLVSLCAGVASAHSARPTAACDCSRVACVALVAGRVTLTGTVVVRQGRDANDDVETYLALRLDVPTCLPAGDDYDALPDARELQLMGAGPTVQLLVGARVTLDTTLAPAITAHHHTPLLIWDPCVHPRDSAVRAP